MTGDGNHIMTHFRGTYTTDGIRGSGVVVYERTLNGSYVVKGTPIVDNDAEYTYDGEYTGVSDNGLRLFIGMRPRNVSQSSLQAQYVESHVDLYDFKEGEWIKIHKFERNQVNTWGARTGSTMSHDGSTFANIDKGSLRGHFYPTIYKIDSDGNVNMVQRFYASSSFGKHFFTGSAYMNYDGSVVAYMSDTSRISVRGNIVIGKIARISVWDEINQGYLHFGEKFMPACGNYPYDEIVNEPYRGTNINRSLRRYTKYGMQTYSLPQRLSFPAYETNRYMTDPKTFTSLVRKSYMSRIYRKWGHNLVAISGDGATIVIAGQLYTTWKIDCINNSHYKKDC